MPNADCLQILQTFVFYTFTQTKNMKIFIKTALLLGTSLLLTTQDVKAQQNTDNNTDSVKLVRKKLYWSSGMDMMLFSTSQTTNAFTLTDGLTPLRFTYFLNFGFHLNYDISKNIGVFTGIGLKNIGFIEKYKAIDSTVKRRVLAIGIPVGIKFGNLHKHTYGFIGGGADLAFNYKEKGYIRRGNKDKFNEWFSDRTNLVMPYVFAGFAFKPGVTLKLQYYMNSFLNPSFNTPVVSGGSTSYFYPYATFTQNNIMMLSVGFDVRYSKKSKKISASTEPAMQTM
jgi:hypothetical protein